MDGKFLLQKHELNIDVANKIKTSHSNSSIHCSYYSCFQRVKYTILIKLGKSEQDILENNKRKPKPLGSHEVFIEAFVQEFQKVDSNSAFSFRNDIYYLKSMRIVADYNDEPIIPTKGEDAYKKAKDINKLLNQYYPNK